MLFGACLKGYFIGVIDDSICLVDLGKSDIEVSGGIWEVYMPYLYSKHKMGFLAGGYVRWDWIYVLEDLFCRWDWLEI